LYITFEEGLLRLKENTRNLTVARVNMLKYLFDVKKVQENTLYSYFRKTYPNITSLTVRNTIKLFENSNIIKTATSNDTWVELITLEEQGSVFICEVCGKSMILSESLETALLSKLKSKSFTIHGKCNGCKNSN
jgi:Fe2+ or Zn2+ uptake regulation protein